MRKTLAILGVAAVLMVTMPAATATTATGYQYRTKESTATTWGSWSGRMAMSTAEPHIGGYLSTQPLGTVLTVDYPATNPSLDIQYKVVS